LRNDKFLLYLIKSIRNEGIISPYSNAFTLVYIQYLS